MISVVVTVALQLQHEEIREWNICPKTAEPVFGSMQMNAEDAYRYTWTYVTILSVSLARRDEQGNV